ncbi:MAG: right-handed parallel beta-helix repeat-containing protein [Deltaproteobacteria bacterium]|nr:right-handed parallel beta-helix repeat-containing protein [Deltaproteobacteria bacterium]
MHKIRKSFIIFIFFNVIVICTPNFIEAATYYVSTSGSAVWADCSNTATPCSWQTAITNAKAGDTVYFRTGVYDPGNAANYDIPAMNPANSGTAGNPIIFKAYPGESPVLTGNMDGPVIGAFNRNYITWDGFTSTQVDTGGVNFLVGVFQSNNITIKNCDLTGLNADTHDNNALIFADTASHLTIENNLIHDSNGLLPGDPDRIEAAVNSAGIILYSTSYATVKNNDFYNNYIGIFDKDAGNYNN